MMGQYTGNVSEADLIKIIVSIEDKNFHVTVEMLWPKSNYV